MANDSASYTLEALLASPGIDDFTNELALERIGRLIDLAGDVKSEDGTAKALEWCDALAQRSLTDSETALLNYFRANAWSNHQRVRHDDRAAAWAWEQPELQKQVLYLRSAVNSLGFESLSPLRRCQILTNLANQLNTVGRFAEAVWYWDKALSINPYFGMALGNRGYGLFRYAQALHDRGQASICLLSSHESLSAALSPEAHYEAGYEGAKALFSSGKIGIERTSILSGKIDLNNYNMGLSDDERRYRLWCLQNRLFLNPLNDLGPHPIANNDPLVLPDFITPITEPPTWTGFFNQMKQEYVAARWLYYEAANADEVHFADRGVTLYNTLDYPAYAISVEKIKAAFNIAYSLFDKIGFFMNDYLGLGVKLRDVSFRKIWYENSDKRRIWPQLSQMENWPLRGLFWLSKDLFDEELHDVLEPDAQALHEIRNHSQHRYLKIHEMLFRGSDDAELPGLWVDRLAYSIQREDFERKTLRLLRLAREALIYLSLGMHCEENRRRQEKGDAILAEINLDLWDDSRKR